MFSIVHRSRVIDARLRIGAVIVCSLAAFAIRAGAQAPARPDSTPVHFTMGTAQTIAGYARFDFAELDARFANAGLPRVAAGAATVGLGADIRVGRALFGAAFQSILTRNQADANYRTRLSGSYSLFDAGFAVVNTRRTAIYPIVGVGATNLSVNVRELGDFVFDDGLRSPRRELGLSGTSAVAHFGVLAEQRFQRGHGSEFALSLRYGVIRGVGTQTWRSDESQVSEGPSGMRGSYLRLAFSKPLGTRRDGILPIAATALQTLLR